ncbi:hypothetical protein [Nocardia camponoti]|uniref:Uncharacterized protein n=1 Tax=Nocardia camponoti TaxID=1616106 RepID=A0A917QEL7_9NOCA|nr:hypothetical protein [Nocardia camponoti]GGK45132.1 hypothetical protein GCM10011591_15940 [Nocardia camponoti]
MTIEFGAAAHPHALGARVRGACAASMSGALALGAHGLVAGGVLPSGTTVVLLAAVAALVGAVVSGFDLLSGRTGLAAVLLGGQLLGHTTMNWTSSAHHHASASPGLAMSLAHAAAAAVAAVLISGVTVAYRAVVTALVRVLPSRYRPPRIPDPLPLRLTYRTRAILRVLVAAPLPSRGPPALVSY